MSISVTLYGGGTTSTNAYGSAYRPQPGDYLQLTVGGSTAWYTVRWVSWTTNPLGGGPQINIGAALPTEPPPPPPA
jgi:hypothetical protein